VVSILAYAETYLGITYPNPVLEDKVSLSSFHIEFSPSSSRMFCSLKSETTYIILRQFCSGKSTQAIDD
jgi:hypothetical protein